MSGLAFILSLQLQKSVQSKEEEIKMICVTSVKVTPGSVTLKAGQWYYNARALSAERNQSNNRLEQQ